MTSNRRTIWVAGFLTFAMLVSGFLVVLTIVPMNARATTLYVGSGPGNYTTIQAALDYANQGDTIFVYGGVYTEDLTVRKGVSLVGEDRDKTIITGTGISRPFEVFAAPVRITGFTVKNGLGNHEGIRVDRTWGINISDVAMVGVGIYVIGDLLENWNTHHIDTSTTANGRPVYYMKNVTGGTIPPGAGQVILANCTGVVVNGQNLSDVYSGIALGFSSGNTVSNSTISSNMEHGIRFFHSDRNSAVNNNVSDNKIGIHLDYSRGNTLSNNTMLNDSVLIGGALLEHWNTHTIDASNTVNGKPLYYWKNVSGGTIPPGAGEVILANTTDVVVENQNVINGTIGIQVGYSLRTRIANNTVTGNHFYGIFLRTSDNTTSSNNTISHNGYGLGFYLSRNSTIAGNTITNTHEMGIALSSSNDSMIANNTLLDNAVGFETFGCEHNYVADNFASGNWYGFELWSSRNNTVVNNTSISNKASGFRFEGSDNNTVSHNTASSNGGDGIELYFFHSGIITGNTASLNKEKGMRIAADIRITLTDNTASSNVQEGVYLYGARDSIIANNTFSNCTLGLYTDFLRYSLVANNTFSNCALGMSLRAFYDGLIVNNTASGNGKGILLNYAFRDRIEHNAISFNSIGLELNHSDNNTILHNDFYSNTDYGVYIYYSNGNAIYHNDFISNARQAVDYGTNSWDNGYPSGGNYWSDYTGADSFNGPNQNIPGSDGIGDTPYVIDLDSKDRYPLMNPYHPRDIIPPSVTITSPTDGSVFRSLPVMVSGVASDTGGSGLNRVEINVNGAGWSTVFGTSSWSRLVNLGIGGNLIEAWAWDNAGNPSTIDSVVVFYTTSPRASFAVTPSSGNITTAFAVDASYCFDYQDPPGLLEVRWDWEDDGTWDTSWSKTKTAQHEYPALGVYTIRLEVIDTDYLTNSTTHQVWVNNTPPSGTITVSPPSGNISTVFDVNAIVSDIEDPSSALEVCWDWENDGVCDTSWSSILTAQVQYTALGTYTIRMEVRDTGGLMGSATARLWVNNTNPIASFALIPATGGITATYEVNASTSTDLEDSTAVLEVRWDWEDDGTWDTTWSAIKTAQHRYSQIGTYTIRLDVRDTGGLSSTTTRQVEVIDDTPPSVVHAPHDDVFVNVAITITATITDDTGARDVYLHYRAVGSSTFTEVRMTKTIGDTYEATIPSQSTPGTVHYYINATDNSNNSARHPQAGEHSFAVKEREEPPALDISILLLIIAAVAAIIAVLVLLLLRKKRAKERELPVQKPKENE